jgi:hypothetical protein
MRRVWVMIAMASLVAGAGCGRKSYEERLGKTLEKLAYDKRIRQNLMEPPKDEKKFTELAIYIRPPKEEALAKTGQLPVSEGQFDLDASFIETKGAQPVVAPPPRAEFVGEVLGVLSNVFGNSDAILTPKFVDEVRNKTGNRFKRLIFSANDKEVKLYTFKQGAHEVALVFVYDPKVKGVMSSKIEYCLDTFAVGELATRLYNGGTAEEAAETGPAGPM